MEQSKNDELEACIDLIKAMTFDMMMGCETHQEFCYLRAVSAAILSFVHMMRDDKLEVKPNWVKLYGVIDSVDTSQLDPKLMDAMDDYRIAIMELVQGATED